MHSMISRQDLIKKYIDFFKKHNYNAYVLDNGKLQPAKEDENWDILFVPQSKLEKVSKYVSELPPTKNKRHFVY